jgi:hypothetical protein
MKLRHAAALALVGWYLMLPPANPNGEPDESTPMTRWTRVGDFKSSRECEGRKFRLHRLDEKTNPRQDEFILSAICVAPDDPIVHRAYLQGK